MVLSDSKKFSFFQFFVYSLLFYFIYRSFSSNFFILDDGFHIYDNPNIQNFSLEKIINLWKISLIPVVYMIWGFFLKLFGNTSALPFKALNLSIHLINIHLAYLIIKKVCSKLDCLTKSDLSKLSLFSFIGALIYGLHPVQVEAIAWSSSLKDLLSTCFFFISILLFHRLRAEKHQFKVNSDIFLLVLSTMLAIMTKPNTIIAVILFPFLDYFLYSRKSLKYYFSYLFLLPLILVFIFLHLQRAYQDKTISAIINIVNEMIYKVPITLSTLFIYLEKIVVPYPIYFFTYSPKTITSYLDFSNLVITLLLFSSICIVSRKLNKQKFLFFPFTIFIILILPNLGIINNPFQNIFSVIANRYLNLPLFSLGLFVTMLCLSLEKKQQQRGLFISFFYLAIITSLFNFQLYFWKKSSSILEYSIRYSRPHKGLYEILSAAYLKEGNFKASEYWERKIKEK